MNIVIFPHLCCYNIFAQARFLNVDLSGEFRVIEFAYYKDKNNYDEGGYETGRSDRGMHRDDSLTVGQSISRIISTEFSYHQSENILVQLQTGTVLALVPSGRISDEQLKEVLGNIVDIAWREYHTNLYVYVHDGYVTLAERLNKIIPCKCDVKKTWVVVGTWLALGVFFYFYSKRKYGVEFGRDIFIVDENKNNMTENEDSHIAAINKKYEGKHFVVTVGCEYGSGGPEIAKMVADYFGIEYYNRDIVDKVVERKYSISEEEVRKEA